MKRYHTKNKDTVCSKDGLAGPNRYLDPQFICMVGLGILPWIILSLGTQWGHFPLFLYVFFFSDPLFLSPFFPHNCIPLPFIRFSYL